jgi:hypothetical protein
MSEAIPFDTQAEAGALACIIDSGDTAMLDQLEEADFHDFRDLAVFRALTSLQADGVTIDSVSVFQRLRDNGDGDGVETYAITELANATPSPANFPTFLATIKDRSARRRMLAEAEAARLRALDLRVPVESTLKESLSDRLKSRRFDYRVKIEDPAPRFSIGSTGICTPGNLTTITAGVKSGKSSFVGAMLASTITAGQSDCLGLVSSNPDGLAVVHFDTEQSRADHHAGILRAMRRANTATAPAWLNSYCATGFSVRELRACLRDTLKHSGAIHSVLLDGAADYVNDVNDPAECNDFVAELHELAIKHDCPIIGVIHFNPGTEKSRGHLGSQLERKSETNLRLDKDDGEIVTVYSLKSRRAPITKSNGPRFAWSSEKHMHLTVESNGQARMTAKAEAMIPVRDDVFLGKSALRWSEMLGAIETTDKCSRRTAERRVAEWKKLGLIQNSIGGLWTPKG